MRFAALHRSRREVREAIREYLAVRDDLLDDTEIREVEVG